MTVAATASFANLLIMSRELPFAHGGAPLTARMRVVPEDFVVEEILGYNADGEGEHRLLMVEKHGANTDWVAQELAAFAGVAPVAVGYAGLKDRHAVTRQTYSVHLGGKPEPDWSTFPHANIKVLDSQAHRRKLKRGALAGNRFVLTLREVQGQREAAEHALASISARGVPSYFGEQRFGRTGANVERAKALFNGRRTDRATRSLLISAARSYLFNEVLAARVQGGTWDQPMDGEIWSLRGSRSWFGPEPWNEALAARLASGDIHPSGPLWGRGALPSAGEVRALEQSIVDAETELAVGLVNAGLQQDRRALRLQPADLVWSWLADDILQLGFTLPPGTYATVVVRELAQTAV